MSLLCVLTASPRTLADVHLLSRRMLAMRASADALLALCDLPDAFAAVMPEDEPLLRALQSAVMAADARAGRFLLLVRRRVWDDASRLYLGESQPISPVQTVSALLDRGQTQVSFAAASFSRTSPVRRTFFLACRPLWMNPVCSPHACCLRFTIARRC